MYRTLLLLLAGCMLLAACESSHNDTSSNPTSPPAPAVKPADQQDQAPPQTPSPETQSEIEKQTPPAPPLSEDFQGKPKLSLFPRAGTYRPEDDNAKGIKFWLTYIDHLRRTSGPIKPDGDKSDNIAFAFRPIKGLDSVGYFSPIAVKPSTTYAVSARFNCDLPEGATAGVGVLEFDRFQWIGEQFSQSLAQKHQLASQPGISLSGKVDNKVEKFTFTTGAKTGMIHLVFFREGKHDRKPVIFDDISIKEVKKQAKK